MCLNYRLLSVFSVLIQHQREPGVFETAAPVLFWFCLYVLCCDFTKFRKQLPRCHQRHQLGQINKAKLHNTFAAGLWLWQLWPSLRADPASTWPLFKVEEILNYYSAETINPLPCQSYQVGPAISTNWRIIECRKYLNCFHKFDETWVCSTKNCCMQIF